MRGSPSRCLSSSVISRRLMRICLANWRRVKPEVQHGDEAHHQRDLQSGRCDVLHHGASQGRCRQRCQMEELRRQALQRVVDDQCQRHELEHRAQAFEERAHGEQLLEPRRPG